MTSEEARSYNMDYLGLDSGLYDRHCSLMEMPMSRWPKPLKDHVREGVARVGMCGDVVASLVADWLREEGE